MIERYSRPQMKKVWSDDNKFAKWLDVEIAVCEGWVKQGAVPREALSKIKMARLNLKRMEALLKETHHDMTAFLEQHAGRGWRSLEDFRGIRRDRVVSHSQIRRPDSKDYHGGHEAAEGYAEPSASGAPPRS